MTVPNPTWSLPPGERTTRRDLIGQFGGGIEGGIILSTSAPSQVLLFSDPAAAQLHGYFDGWAAPDLYLYTGTGRVGDQRLQAGGNKAILTHRDTGRDLRLFTADGKVPGTRTVRQFYVGEFETDAAVPFTRQDALDRNGDARTIVVFRLRPVRHVERREGDGAGTPDISEAARSSLVDPDENDGDDYETEIEGGTTVARPAERRLVGQYRDFLRAQGHNPKRNRIRPPGELHDLLTDLYDVTAGELYEAKGTATRLAVRHAIGQLLDYCRHINPAPQASTLLLPVRPQPDLLSLIHSVGMGCVYQTPEGGWDRV